jgi:DNA polymerase-3 subunit delta
MSYTKIISDLKQKKYAPIYFLMGEEPYFIDKISDYIEKNVLQEHERDFNLTIFYGKILPKKILLLLQSVFL